jgi:hypothetical protein
MRVLHVGNLRVSTGEGEVLETCSERVNPNFWANEAAAKLDRAEAVLDKTSSKR